MTDMFQYILGWIATVVSVLAVIAFVAVAIVTDAGGVGYVIVRLVWMPFVFLWGLGRIRDYRRERRS